MNKIKIPCLDCKEFRLVNTNGMLVDSYSKIHPRCRRCAAKSVEDKISKGWFEKGITPWNKGTKGVMKANSGSIKSGERRGKETEFKAGESMGDENINWKGKDVGYYALHSWINKKHGKADKCEKCGNKEKVEWANKDYNYTRNIKTWMKLCKPCHVAYDRKNGWGKATRKFGLCSH